MLLSGVWSLAYFFGAGMRMASPSAPPLAGEITTDNTYFDLGLYDGILSW